MPPRIDTLAKQYTAGLPPEDVAALVAKVRAQARRLEVINDCPTPADLAAKFDPTFVRTEAGDLISRRIVEAVNTYDGRVTVSQPPQTGKALDVSTSILTTAGWSTMGELRVGDQVFHPDGHPTRVAAVHPVRRDRRCYRVTTTDGRSVVCDGAHLWTVRDRARRGGGSGANAPAPWEIVTTEQLLERGLVSENGRRANGAPHRAYRFNLPRQYEIVSKPVDLPVDPYLLGVWLGDGDSAGAQLTVGDQDLDEMCRLAEASGAWIVSKRRDRTAWRVRFNVGPMRDGFESRCRRLGVWGNKHIPDIYLTAGVEQRLALLQGLLDTDGTICFNKVSRRAVFCVCNRRLAEGALYLARSLGWRATIHEGAAKLNGVEVSRKWTVAFTPEQGQHVPFRFHRKAEHIQTSQARAGELNAVSIKTIEPVESRPVRCITVDREDGLFLAGRDLLATHNSLTLRWACAWLLLNDPDTRIVYASYSQGLARTSGRIIRSLIETHFGPYGLTLDRSHADASDWQLEGHLGGLLAAGTGSSLTGRASSVMIIDDPHPSMAAADSPTQRNNVLEWWSAVARTRLAPGAPVVGVATRWHEADLISTFIGEGWPSVNIPAQADGQTPDALDRDPGTYLVTPRGTTAEDWQNTRKEVGERTWAALYQGRPAPLTGGVFKSAWFDIWRVHTLPPGCLPLTVVVDPADNEGDGDEAGIILATSHPDTGKVYVVDDMSAPMTIARWARMACLACVRRDAPTLAYEQSLSQLPKRIREAWATLHQQATALRRAGGDLRRALDRLSRPDDSPEARDAIEQALLELSTADVDGILAVGQSGPRLRKITARGSKQSRMQWAAPKFETGRAVMVGRHAVLEHQAAVWQVGQDSPDRVDAMVHACALLDGASAAPVGRAEDRVPTTSTSLRNHAGNRITRSTRR